MSIQGKTAYTSSVYTSIMDHLCEVCHHRASKTLGVLHFCDDCYQCYADEKYPSLMSENSIPNSFICQAHSNFAVKYCLCTEERVYLCEICLQKHLKIPGVHSLVKVGDVVTDAESVAKYNRKLEVCSALQKDLESLRARLDSEEQNAMKYLEGYKQYHISVMEQTYADLMASAQSRYSSLRALFTALISDLQTCKRSAVPSLSRSTATFIDYAVHVQNEILPFIDMAEVVSTTIKLGISKVEHASDPLVWWLQGWNLMQGKLCTCERCEDYRDLMGLPPQIPWICIHCRQSNVARRQCDCCGCGKEWVDYLLFNCVQLNENYTRWRCNCGTVNSLTEAKCGSCVKENEVIRNGLMGRGNATPLSMFERLKVSIAR